MYQKPFISGSVSKLSSTLGSLPKVNSKGEKCPNVESEKFYRQTLPMIEICAMSCPWLVRCFVNMLDRDFILHSVCKDLWL